MIINAQIREIEMGVCRDSFFHGKYVLMSLCVLTLHSLHGVGASAIVSNDWLKNLIEK
jgi:hypothetical protein